MTESEFEQLYKKLDEYVVNNVNEHRYAHTLGVVKCAEQLAVKYGADVQKAKIAAIFHDACKNDVGGLEHGEAAAKLIREKFGVTDEDIINSIAYHTIGRPNMSLLEKVIKLADLLEEGRTYEDVPEIREYERTHYDIDGTYLKLLLKQKHYLVQRGIDYDKRTDVLIDWMEKEIGKKQMTNKDIAYLIAEELDKRKAGDISIIDIAEKSGFADYFVIANASNLRQLVALSDEVDNKLASIGIMVHHIEGKGDTGWILMDYGDIIVNLFTIEQRNHYNIDKLWSDCIKLDFEPKEM